VRNGFVPSLAIEKLRNTVAPWQMPVNHSLRYLQRCGAFTAAFTREKRWMTKKKFIAQFAIDTEYFSTHLPIFV
jgi:hypothetical protein